MSLRQAATRFALLLGTLAPLACAVEQLDIPEHADDGGSGGAGTAGLPPITMAGRPSTGGNTSGAGSPSTGGQSGSTSTGGNVSNGGNVSTGGNTSKGGSPGGGNSTGGSSAGNSSGGGGGVPVTTGCNGLKEWKTGDPNLTIAVDEVIQWKGKKYKCVKAVSFPNSGCEPDAPAMWCADWFAPAGDC